MHETTLKRPMTCAKRRPSAWMSAAMALLLGGALLGSAGAAAVKLAPDFFWEGTGGKGHPLKQLRGQPVVVVIAPSPDAKPMRQQAGKIEDAYLDFSGRKTVFIAAFTAQKGRVASNVPFVIAQDGAAVAKAYGVADGGFAVVVIGADGNVDMQSDRVEAAQRILDIINNSFQPQATARKGQGG
jgi:peroxiredoxin